MSWTLIPPPVDLAVGLDVRTARIGTQLHILAGRPAGDGVNHLRLEPDGSCELLPTLPLAVVTGAAAGPNGLVLTGAEVEGHAAVVQTWPEPPIRLAASVAAWPVPVGGDPVRVGWATGQGPATVWLADLASTGIAAEPVLHTDAVFDLQVAGWDGEVDLLCETAAGARLVRVQGGRPAEAAAPRHGLLAPGFLLTPGEGEVVRHSLDLSEAHSVRLPEWPTGQRRRIARLTLNDQLLCWTTERIDEPTDPEPLGWVARIDPASGSLGPAVALPEPGRPAAVHLLEDRLVVVQPAGGRLDIWLGRGL